MCTGADVEMITAGGEAAFVGKMVMESASLQHRCRCVRVSRMDHRCCTDNGVLKMVYVYVGEDV